MADTMQREKSQIKAGWKRPHVLRDRCACTGRSDVDGGYAFVVLFASFVILGVTVGQCLCTNLYFTVFLRIFHGSHFLTSFVGSMMTTVMYLSGLVVPVVLNSLGARLTIMLGGVMTALGLVLTAFAHQIWVVFITYGFLLGAGCCLAFCGSLKALSLYFSQRLRLATGLATCGSGIGLFVMGPLLQWAEEYYGWRGLLFINAGVTLQMTICGALVFPKDDTKLEKLSTGNGLKNEHRMTYRERLMDKRALCLCFVAFLQGMSILFVFVVFKDLFNDLGMVESYTLCLMVVGIVSTACRIVSSTLTIYVSPLLVHAGILSIVAVGTILLIVSGMTEPFYVGIAVMLGVGQAVFTTLPISVAVIFGRAEMAPTYAIMQAYAGVGTLVGPAVGGYIRDVTGTYDGGLLLAGGFLFTAAMVTIGLDVFQRRSARRKCLEAEVEVPLQDKNMLKQ